MENAAEDLGALHRRVEDALKAKVPQEGLTNSMAILYRPNNCRRQTTTHLYKIAPPFGKSECYYLNENRASHNRLKFWRNGRILFQLGPKKLTAIWDQHVNGKKEVYRFRGSPNQIVDGILAVKERIRVELDEGILGVLRAAGLVPGPIVWERAEEMIKGDEFIDRIPRNLVLHDTVFKKVYPDETEFLTRKGGEASLYVKNYIKNRALEEVAPAIVAELSRLHELVEVRIDPVEALMGELRRRVALGEVWYDALVVEPLRGVVERLSVADRIRLTEELIGEVDAKQFSR